MGIIDFLKTKTGIFFFGFVGGGMALSSIKDNCRGQHFKGTIRADGKVVLVTGANTGIGLETARELAQRGAEVYMLCRNMKRCELSRKEIVADTGNEAVHCRQCDLSSQQSIREFVKMFESEKKRIDVLINNAAVMKCPRLETKEGIELQFGINHLGHFLLTNLLLDKLKTSAPSRIIVLTDYDYVKGQINLDDLNSEKEYNKSVAYNQSKLANMLFVRELAKRLQGSGVTVNAVNPGDADTEIHRFRWYYNGFIYPFVWTFLKSAPAGAQTTLYVALKRNLRKKSGLYFSDCTKAEIADVSKDNATAEWLWKVSEKWTNLVS